MNAWTALTPDQQLLMPDPAAPPTFDLAVDDRLNASGWDLLGKPRSLERIHPGRHRAGSGSAASDPGLEIRAQRLRGFRGSAECPAVVEGHGAKLRLGFRLTGDTRILSDESRGDYLVIDVPFDNRGSGKSYGLELAADLKVRDWWRLVLAYSYIEVDVRADSDSLDTTNRQLRFAETIQHSGKTLLAIINDILDFSKIEAGKLSLNRRDFALRKLVEQAVQLFTESASAKGLRVSATMSRDIPEMVNGDAARLSQILINLIGNAVKFTNEAETEFADLVKVLVRDFRVSA